MDIAKIETITNLYLDMTAKLVPEKFPFETASLENFNEVEECNPCLVGILTS